MPILVRPLNADEGRIYLEIVNSAIRGLAVRHYAFEGSIALDRLVSGVIELVPQTGVASPTGTADGWPMLVEGFSDRQVA